MQTGRRFIENVKHAGLAFRRVTVRRCATGRARSSLTNSGLKVRGQLHALRFASRERRGRLAQPQVSEADFIEHNLEVIKTADWVIDLGPEGGDRGGNLVGAGSPEAISELKISYTGQYLKWVLNGNEAPWKL